MIDWNEKQLGEEGEVLLFELSGRLDTTGVDYIYSVLEHRISNGHKKMVLDCDDLQFVSSVGLGMLMRVHAKMKKQGGDVKLSRVHGGVAEVLKLVMLDKVLHIYPTADDAAKSFN